jgi:hypothetical protein
VDRSVDWVTPMCTQLTYEGMLDEFVGIKNGMSALCRHHPLIPCLGHIEVDTALLDPAPPQATPPIPTLPPAQSKKRKHHLDPAKDRLLTDIRDLNFAVVGTRLSKFARRLEGDYGGVKNLKSVSEMKSFVGKLGGLQTEQQSLRLREPTLKVRCGVILTCCARYRVDGIAHANHQN